MSNTVLSDNGPFLAMKPEEADKLFDEIASLEIDLAKDAAITARRLDRITTAHNAAIAERVEKRNNLAKKLNSYINAHKDAFKNPRAKKTVKGSYGLRTTAGKLVIGSEEEVIAFSDAQKLSLYADIKQIDKKALKEYLEDVADDAPKPKGVTFEKGETAFYKVEKKLLEDAAKINIE